MTTVLLEPFQNLAAWTLTGTPTIVYPGRTGLAVQTSGSAVRADYNIAAGVQSDTVTIGCAFRWTDASALDRNIVRLYNDAGVTEHDRLLVSTTGVLQVMRAPGTVIANSGAFTLALNTWYYVEWQIFLHDTTGWTKVRVDGVERINATALDTKNTSTGVVYDQVRIGGQVTGAIHQYDDLYINNDATFLGVTIVAEPCVQVLNDPFKNYSNWTIAGGTPLIGFGRNGRGALINNAGQIIQRTLSAPEQSDTLTYGFAFQTTSLAADRYIISHHADAGVTLHGNLVVLTTGALVMTRGTGTTNILATSSAGLITINTWYFIEVQIRLADTGGSVTLRINGSVAASAPSVDTKNGGTAAVYDTIRITGVASLTYTFDDFYLTTGTGCTFRGDTAIAEPDPCVEVLKEPFDNLSAWTQNSTPVLVAGRNGTGVEGNSSSDWVDYAVPAANQSGTFTLGCAFKTNNLAVNPDVMVLMGDGGTVIHSTVKFQNDGSLLGLRGASGLGPASAPGLVAINTWYYVEMQVTLSPVSTTTGSMVVRLNGTQVLNYTSVNTNGGSVGAVFDKVRLRHSALSTTAIWDDFYLRTGTGCAFRGDIPIAGTPAKVWNGSAFVDGTWKVYNGSAYVDAIAVKTWNGSAFV